MRTILAVRRYKDQLKCSRACSRRTALPSRTEIRVSEAAPAGQPLQGSNVRLVRAFIVKAGNFEHPRQVRQGRVSQHAPKGLASEQSQSDVLVTVDRAASMEELLQRTGNLTLGFVHRLAATGAKVEDNSVQAAAFSPGGASCQGLD